MMQDVHIEKTKAWISEFIIDKNICPFAAKSFLNEQIKYQVFDGAHEEQIKQSFAGILAEMNRRGIEAISNAFLIAPDFVDLEDFLDLVHDFEVLLDMTQLSSSFQLVGFHPKYQFDGLEVADVANLRNRSPFPMLHILRVQEVESAIEGFGDTNKIINRNIQFLRDQAAD